MLRRAPYWIQKADFSATEHEPVDAAGACDVMVSHDWDAELAFRDHLEEQGQEFCDPGIGFVRVAGEFLHLCPTPDGRAMVFYNCSERRRFLWLFSRNRTVSYYSSGVDRPELCSVIERWFADDRAWLVDFFDSMTVVG